MRNHSRKFEQDKSFSSFSNAIDRQRSALNSLGAAAERAANGEIPLTRLQRLGNAMIRPFQVASDVIHDGNEAALELPKLQAQAKLDAGQAMTFEELTHVSDQSVAFNPLRSN